jgi:hypothetical protein
MTMKMVMDYDLAMAIGRDAGNRSMRKAGRTAWSREDYNASVDAFEACLPTEWTVWTCGPVKRAAPGGSA